MPGHSGPTSNSVSPRLPSAGARGGRIENGDELVLGQARLRVTLKSGKPGNRKQEPGAKAAPNS